MRKILCWVTVTILLLTVAGRLLKEASVGGASGSVIEIGAIAVLTGEGAAWGVNQQRGSIMAAEEWNARGGIEGRRISLLYEDSPSGIARNAVAAYNRLVHDRRVRFILGPVAMDELLAVAPLAERDEVFLGGATYMPNAPKNFFTTWIDADLESDLIAAHIYQRHKRVAILASQQSWESQIARRFQKTFRELGGEIVLLEEPVFDAASVKSEVLRLKGREFDALFVTSYLLLPRYLKEVQTLGITAPIFSIELDQSVIDSSGAGAEGLVFIAPSAPSHLFVKKFTERWGEAPAIPAASAYDAANMLFTAIRESGGEYTKVINYFSHLNDYPGVTGRISKRDGKTVVSTSFYVVREGRIAELK